MITTMLCLMAGKAQAIAPLPATVSQLLDLRSRAVPACCANEEPIFAPTRVIDGEELVDAFVVIDDEATIAKLTSLGVRDICSLDGLFTARIPVSRLVEVCQLPGVADVEISRALQLCTDSTLSVTHAGDAINGTAVGLPADYDGTGVVVGIIDVGFDYQHRAYMRADDSTVTRIVRVYDTQSDAGHPAKYGKRSLSGSVFMGDEIYQLTTDGNGTHGTHTSSIAAGTHVNGYGGMAPGADIVLCAVSYLGGSMSASEIAGALYYIKAYADSVGKPCVTSMSMSSNTGSHDGMDYFSSAIKKVTGPGHIYVISASNQAGNNGYAYGQATADKPVSMFVNSTAGNNENYYYANNWVDSWMRTDDVAPAYRYHIVDLDTRQVVWQSDEFTSSTKLPYTAFSEYFEPDTATASNGYLSTTVTHDYMFNPRYEVITHFYNLRSKSWTTDAAGVKHGNYALGISIWPANETDTCWVDNWIGNSYSEFGWMDSVTVNDEVVNDFYLTSSDSCSIITYAACDSVISAGAFAARDSHYSLNRGTVLSYADTYTVGDIAPFSGYEPAGYGPTGKALPTVCSPGVLVVAAGSRYSYMADASTKETVMKTDDGCVWGVMTGTSTTAPTVAGIIAQWLQADPTLSPSGVKRIIEQTAIHDAFTKGVNSSRFGPNGKIDALAGLQLILKDKTTTLLGDANGDGVVDITDVTAIIDYVLGSGSEPFIFANADINGDGTIDVTDVTMVIDIILQQQTDEGDGQQDSKQA